MMSVSSSENLLRPIAQHFQTDGLSSLSALEQAARIADGTLSSLELVEHYLARIARHDETVGAFVDLQADTARRDAERADKERRAGHSKGVFHGVPTAVKDHHLVRFTRTTIGSSSFNWLWSPVDDDVVKRLRQAGFIIIGKTAMSELGLLPIVESQHAPPSRNPWDLSRTAGGSSGGAGAALAAGLLPVAQGSDGAGSVRIPAALNGLYGLKPTRGLVPSDSSKIDPFGLTTDGPLARSIDDAAALLDALVGSDGTFLRRSREPAPRLRIGVIMDPPFGEVDPRIVARVELAVQQLIDGGHEVERRDRPMGTLEEFTPVYQKLISRVPFVQASKLEPTTRWFVESGRALSLNDLWSNFRALEEAGNHAMAGLDVIITPTVGVVTPKVGEFSHLPPSELFRESAALGMFTAIANVTGQPGLSVPFGEVEGMPVGVQLLGRKGDDALLLQLGRELRP